MKESWEQLKAHCGQTIERAEEHLEGTQGSWGTGGNQSSGRQESSSGCKSALTGTHHTSDLFPQNLCEYGYAPLYSRFPKFTGLKTGHF